MSDAEYRLTCLCGLERTGNKEGLERIARRHGYPASGQTHEWLILDSDGNVVKCGP